MTAIAIPDTGQLKPRLGIAFALAVSVGNIIGSGIMRTPGLVADQVGSAWMVIGLWVFGGVHALLLANVAAELATCLPKAGGSFVAVRAAFGETTALLAGWTEWLARTASISALSVASANFLAIILPGTASHTALIASGFALAVVAINWTGVRGGQVAQVAGSIAKVGLIGGVIAVAFLAEPVPVSGIAAQTNSASPAAQGAGLLAIVSAYQLIYGAYAGWQAPIYFVEEDRNAARNIPRALGVSVLLVSAIYVALNLSLLNALDLPALRASDLPVALVIENAFGRSGGAIVALIAIMIVVGALNALVMAGPRILYGMARDGLFPKAAMQVNKGGTPDRALVITTALALVLIFSGGFVFLFKLMAALASFVFLIYSTSLFALRARRPDLSRPFRAIGYPVLPALACVLNAGLLIAFIAAEPVSGLYMAGLIAVCVPVGAALKRRRLGSSQSGRS
ncbi:MAG: amino acid permease [Sphingomonadaceae bacterium]|nr:amino acid permease [Sphingomonadaceae bacterium]